MNRIAIRNLKSANQSLLRDINEVSVLRLIRERQPISRIAIAEMTGLEPGTVTRILQRFARGGLISETGVGPSTPLGGRKPRYVTLNPGRDSVIGVDLGARETLLALSDFNGRIQDFRRISNTPDPDATLGAVAADLLLMMQRANSYTAFGGIGVGLIGLINCEDGVILEGENMGWPEPIEVGRILRSKIRDVPLYFENAARLSAMGEIWFGSLRLSGVRDMVFLQIDDGVGTGIIIDGQIYTGYCNGAGEFGHVCIDPQGPRCSCGSNGCLEAFASDLATTKRYLQKCGASDGSGINMQFIVDLANKGDPYALAALRETGHYLGLGLAPIIYGLSPQKIVIGGAIARAWPLLEQEVWNACALRVSEPFRRNTTLVASATQYKASLMGAISLVLAQNFAVPHLFTVA